MRAKAATVLRTSTAKASPVTAPTELTAKSAQSDCRPGGEMLKQFEKPAEANGGSDDDSGNDPPRPAQRDQQAQHRIGGQMIEFVAEPGFDGGRLRRQRGSGDHDGRTAGRHPDQVGLWDADEGTIGRGHYPHSCQPTVKEPSKWADFQVGKPHWLPVRFAAGRPLPNISQDHGNQSGKAGGRPG